MCLKGKVPQGNTVRDSRDLLGKYTISQCRRRASCFVGDIMFNGLSLDSFLYYFPFVRMCAVVTPAFFKCLWF